MFRRNISEIPFYFPCSAFQMKPDRCFHRIQNQCRILPMPSLQVQDIFPKRHCRFDRTRIVSESFEECEEEQETKKINPKTTKNAFKWSCI
jgi:hypothetical protein